MYTRWFIKITVLIIILTLLWWWNWIFINRYLLLKQGLLMNKTDTNGELVRNAKSNAYSSVIKQEISVIVLLCLILNKSFKFIFLLLNIDSFHMQYSINTVFPFLHPSHFLPQLLSHQNPLPFIPHLKRTGIQMIK